MGDPALRYHSPVTGEELFAMGDIGPCELIDGEIVTMSPTGIRHGMVEAELSHALLSFVRARGLGRVVTGEVGIYVRRNPDRVRAADIAFIPRGALTDGVPSAYLEAVPELVVEIISPSDRWSDMHAKLEDYFSIGVPSVWVVEPERRGVRVYHSPTELTQLTVADVLEGEGALAGFSLPVARLFE